METNTLTSGMGKLLGTHNTTKEEPHAKVVLIWDNNTLRTISDMREHFTAEELLKSHMQEDLYNWLVQHYYETEANAVRSIKKEDPVCLKKLCNALGINFSVPAIDPAELEAKKELLRKYTTDEKIICNAEMVAMDQEDLAELLNCKQKMIYLCNNHFSIPLSRPNIHYIGIGNVTIDNAFTLEQYQRAKIKVEGISLPKNTTNEMDALAMEGAIQNGYDDFALHHTPLATIYHQKLIARKITSRYRLPYNTSIVAKRFSKKFECEQARNTCINKAHRDAESYFSFDSAKYIAKEAADFYKEWIEQAFTPTLDSLNTLCKIIGKEDSFLELQNKITHCRKNLKERYVEELNTSADYYKMYDINYFKEQVGIEREDSHFSKGGLFKGLETLFTDCVQYSISNIYTSIMEMEKDLNDHANTFFNAAYAEYQEYVSEMMDILDIIGGNLPEPKKNEAIGDYLERCCIASQMRN